MQFQRLDLRDVNVGIRNTVVSILSGILFAAGWWIIIDASTCYGPESLPHATHAIGCMATIGFILINLIPSNVFTGEMENSTVGYIFVFISMLITFGSIIAACWVMFASYVTGTIIPVWPGVAIFLQNILIVTSTFLFRFGRSHDSSGFGI